MSDVEMAEIDADDDLNISDGKGILSGSEEGEINESDSDSASSRHRHKESESIKNTAIKYSFQTEVNNSINRSIFDDVDLAKMGDRATRFGFDKESDINSLEKEKTDLYESLSIVTQEDIRHARLDTIHVNGVENMKTSDVFEYFFAHKPLFLEWVSDSSCNVVWTDDISAAKAMVFYSKEILLDSDDAMDGKEMAVKTGDSIRLADIKAPVPPGRWRAGAPHPAADFIFLRFANKSDKKVSGNDEMKVLSKKYKESINTENIQTGLISESMKSKIKSMKEKVYDLDEEKGKNPWGELCETWGINDSQEVFGIPKPSVADLPPPHAFPQRKYLSVRHRIGKAAGPHGALPVTERLSMPVAYGRNGGNVKNRLGKRTPVVIDVSDSSESEEEEEQHEEEDSGSSDDSEEEWTSKRKVPRMRMHADDEQEKINKKRINPDQSSAPWDEDDADIDTITIEVKNEIVERPRATVDSEEDDRRTKKSRTTTTKRDLRSRIGRRKSSNDSDSDASSSPQQSYTKHSAPATTVWSRLDNSRSKQIESCSDSDSESPRDLRRTLTKSTAKIISNRPGFNKDLRSRLGKKSDFRASPLRIEVDNEHYARSDEE